MDLTRFIHPELIGLMLEAGVEGSLAKPSKPFKAEIEATARVLFDLVLNGPKLFSPPEELLQAIENLDLAFPISEYAQPYPEFILDYTSDCYVLTAVRDGFLVVMLWPSGERIYRIKWIKLTNQTLDEMIAGVTDLDKAWAQVIKTALRINTVLMWAGVQQSGTYLDEKAYKRSQRSGRFQERNIERVYIKQQVKVIEQLKRAVTRPENPEHGDGTVRPHWRRAHMKRVAYGPKHSLRKLKLIAACFVNKKLFTGDLSETETIYS